MAKSLGRKNILYKAMRNGACALSIVITWTVYARANGTFYYRVAGQRFEVTPVQARAVNGYNIEFVQERELK